MASSPVPRTVGTVDAKFHSPLLSECKACGPGGAIMILIDVALALFVSAAFAMLLGVALGIRGPWAAPSALIGALLVAIAFAYR
jgi:hypothetical protein